jgi:hypothetical protein
LKKPVSEFEAIDKQAAVVIKNQREQYHLRHFYSHRKGMVAERMPMAMPHFSGALAFWLHACFPRKTHFTHEDEH